MSNNNKPTRKELYKRFTKPRVSWLKILSWIDKSGSAVCLSDVADEFGFSTHEASARLCKLRNRKYIKELNKIDYAQAYKENPISGRGRPPKYYVITERGQKKL